MAIFGARLPIESGEHILRARRTAALTRVAMGVVGIVLLLGWPALTNHQLLASIGFATIVLTALVQLAAPRLSFLTVEESLSGSAAVLIVGFGGQHVDIISLLWLVAVVSGVLARGGRVHWVGSAIVLCALVLPVPIVGGITAEYGAFCVAVITILLTSGRVTQELNLLLRQARRQADSAETLLLAGEIAARVAGREGAPTTLAKQSSEIALSEEEIAHSRIALARLVEGEGLAMVVQPIVDIETGVIHAYEALARFGEAGPGSSPLHWFALAEQLGARPALERACLREALALLSHRPAGTVLTVNLSAPILLEQATMTMLLAAAVGESDELRGLVIEITEETLVLSGEQLHRAVTPLTLRGARLAVDDMGAGYSGLRQITSILPAYLKLDRALCCGIDHDEDRAALVAALAGYGRQVGSHLIAEGIETTAELLALRRIGVPLVQGFLLATPGEPWPNINVEAAQPPRSQPAEALDPTEWLERSVGRAPAPPVSGERTATGPRATAH